MEINAANIAALSTGYKTIFNEAFAAGTPSWDKVAMLVPSSNASEQYGWLSSLPKMREWLGDRQVQNLSVSDYTIKNKLFESTIGVKRTAIEDDHDGTYTPSIRQLAMTARNHPDELVFGLLKAGFSTPCYDGQYFFDTDHPGFDDQGNAISVSNFGGGSGTNWFLIAGGEAVKPLIFQKRRDYAFMSMDKLDDANVFQRAEFIYGVDARVNAGYGLWQLAYGSKATLDATSYAAARAAMKSLRGANGSPLNVRPDLLVVPPALEGTALALINNEMIPGGGTNTWKGTAQVLVSPYVA